MTVLFKMIKLLVTVIALCLICPDICEAEPEQPTTELFIAPSTFLSTPDNNYTLFRYRIAGARHGYLFVPSNRSKRQGTKVAIGFWILPTTSLHPRAPIIYLDGGPGHASIDVWRHWGQMSRDDWQKKWPTGHGFDLLDQLRATADVILFDQRGSGSPSESVPSLQCGQAFSFAFDLPWRTRNDMIKGYGDRAVACATEWRKQGVEIGDYTSEAAAADIDDLRLALGYRKLNIWGYSFGSYLARTFINMFPNSVERAFIGGMVNQAGISPPIDENPTLEAIRRIKAGFTTYNGTVIPPDPAIEQEIVSTQQRLAEKPVVVHVIRPDDNQPADITLGRFDYDFQVVWGLASGTSDWAAMAAHIHDVAGGNYGWLADEAALWKTGKHRSLVEGKLNGYVMSCAGAKPTPRGREIEAHDPFQGEIGEGPFPEVCDALKAFAIPADRHWRPNGVETLYYNGEQDPQTPLSQMVDNFRASTRAELVVVCAASHSDVNRLPDEFWRLFAGGDLVPGKVLFVQPERCTGKTLALPQ